MRGECADRQRSPGAPRAGHLIGHALVAVIQQRVAHAENGARHTKEQRNPPARLKLSRAQPQQRRVRVVQDAVARVRAVEQWPEARTSRKRQRRLGHGDTDSRQPTVSQSVRVRTRRVTLGAPALTCLAVRKGGSLDPVAAPLTRTRRPRPQPAAQRQRAGAATALEPRCIAREQIASTF